MPIAYVSKRICDAHIKKISKNVYAFMRMRSTYKKHIEKEYLRSEQALLKKVTTKF